MSNVQVVLINFLMILESIFSLLILVRILMSWLKGGRRGGFGNLNKFVFESTEPLFVLARKLPYRAGMFDLSPIIAIIGLSLVTQVLIIIIASL